MGIFIYSAVILLIIYLIRKFIEGNKANKKSMKNKVIIVTGASDGIGKAQALQLLEDGANVIFACRNESKTRKVMQKIKYLRNSDDCYKRAHFIKLDLTSFKSVDSFINEFKRKFDSLDILVNNAAIAASIFELTEDGLESTIQTNHYSHVKLTLGLLDMFNKTEGRIINVSSLGHKFSNYDTSIKESFRKDQDQYRNYFKYIPQNLIPYGNSKLANIYFTEYLVDLFNSDDKYKHLFSYSVHPGAVDTNFNHSFKKYSILWTILLFIFYPLIFMFFKTPIDGAQTQLFLCYSNTNELKQGGYYEDCKLGRLFENAKIKEIKDYLMEETLKLVS